MASPSLQERIAELESEIRDVDEGSAEMLQDLRLALREDSKPSGWLAVNPSAVLPIERLAEGIASRDARPRLAAWLELVRNGLVLLPIAITWLSLAYAAAGYQAALAADPTLIDQPFLLLWERGFEDLLAPPLSWLGFLRLGVVAVVDVALIVLVIAFTVAIQHEVSVQEAARESSRRAASLRLAEILGRAHLELAGRRSTPALVSGFLKSSRDLVDELKAERLHVAKLGDDRERQLADLKGALQELRRGMDAFSAGVAAQAPQLARIEAVGLAISSGVGEIASAESGLTTALGHHAEELRHDHSLMATTATHVGSSAEALMAALEQALPAIGHLSVASNAASTTLTSLDDSLRRDSESRRGLDGRLTKVVEGLPEALTDIRSTLTSLASQTEALSRVIGQMAKSIAKSDEAQDRFVQAVVAVQELNASVLSALDANRSAMELLVRASEDMSERDHSRPTDGAGFLDRFTRR